MVEAGTDERSPEFSQADSRNSIRRAAEVEIVAGIIEREKAMREPVLDKHFLKITQYPFYTCTCGYEVSLFISDDTIHETVIKKPATPVKLLSCGHAACCEHKTWKGELLCWMCELRKD